LNDAGSLIVADADKANAQLVACRPQQVAALAEMPCFQAVGKRFKCILAILIQPVSTAA